MSNDVSRREFLQRSALAAGGSVMWQPWHASASSGSAVALVVSPVDRVAAAPPVRWAVAELRQALERRGIAVTMAEAVETAPAPGFPVIIAGLDIPIAAAMADRAGVRLVHEAESLAILPGARGGRPVLAAAGHDARGLTYAVLELADRVQHAADPLLALTGAAPLVERPFNAVRAIGRPFVSDVEDTPWFRDRAFWPAYFGMLARQRVNRFHLALGFGYDTLRWVADAYLLFAYPFLTAVPGYNVRAVNLPDAERDANLDAIRVISCEAAAHGIDFQLGLWTHGCVWADSPNANYTIEGLTPANQAAYCRDALALVLRACPDITGVTLRTHYESGVREGSYAFWNTIFEGVPRSGRTLEIELHAKGLDRTMIDGARSVGAPVRVCGKYWAEHVGLPYHQAAIRELERPHVDPGLDPFSALSMGSRNHTRYGYADFLEEDRPYGFMFRVFPGTHKFLLWGDPVTAAAHARAFQFCGSDGAELLEPLAFKGRRGSGVAGSRCAYRDPAANPAPDWEKYVYTYALWGRLLYDPGCDPEVWRRVLRARYGESARPLESALGAVTRILPIITTAHTPSAAQDTYSPEFYTNQSIAEPAAPAPYGDTPSPKVFGTVSPLDPQLFSTIDEYAGRLLARDRSAKYSPVEVAQWIEDLAETSAATLAEAGRAATPKAPPEFARTASDIRIQLGLGRFFAAKFRSAALYAVFKQSNSRRALEEAVVLYRQARDHWARMAEEASRVYAADITFGPLPHQRGHWLDRLPAIDADIAVMARALEAASEGAPDSSGVRAAIDEIRGRPLRPQPECRHTPPARVARGTGLALTLTCPAPASPTAVRLHYRHVNQAERYQAADMERRGDAWHATIPDAYTDSAFPLQVLLRNPGRRRQGVVVSRPRAGPRRNALLHRPAGPPRGVTGATIVAAQSVSAVSSPPGNGGSWILPSRSDRSSTVSRHAPARGSNHVRR